MRQFSPGLDYGIYHEIMSASPSSIKMYLYTIRIELTPNHDDLMAVGEMALEFND